MAVLRALTVLLNAALAVSLTVVVIDTSSNEGAIAGAATIFGVVIVGALVLNSAVVVLDARGWRSAALRMLAVAMSGILFLFTLVVWAVALGDPAGPTPLTLLLPLALGASAALNTFLIVLSAGRPVPS